MKFDKKKVREALDSKRLQDFEDVLDYGFIIEYAYDFICADKNLQKRFKNWLIKNKFQDEQDLYEDGLIGDECIAPIIKKVLIQDNETGEKSEEIVSLYGIPEGIDSSKIYDTFDDEEDFNCFRANSNFFSDKGYVILKVLK